MCAKHLRNGKGQGLWINCDRPAGVWTQMAHNLPFPLNNAARIPLMSVACQNHCQNIHLDLLTINRWTMRWKVNIRRFIWALQERFSAMEFWVTKMIWAPKQVETNLGWSRMSVYFVSHSVANNRRPKVPSGNNNDYERHTHKQKGQRMSLGAFQLLSPLNPAAHPALLWDEAVKLNCRAHLYKQSSSPATLALTKGKVRHRDGRGISRQFG